MIEKLKALWARLRVRWHALVIALVAAAPEILNYLGAIDLRPILEHFFSPDTAGFIVGVMPFALLFLKPAFHLSDEEE